MKKLFIVSLMVLSLVFAGNAFAADCNGGGCEGNPVQASGNYNVLPMDYDSSKSVSGYGNDYGFADGFYGIGGDMNTFADAEGCSREWVWTGWFRGYYKYTPNKAYEQGAIFAQSKTKAWSWAKDRGLTSKAGAGVKADEGYVVIEGFVSGKGNPYGGEFISSRIHYAADFYQSNAAKETGYNAGEVYAFNESGLMFDAVSDWKYGTFLGFHLNSECYTPDVITKGKSEVTIDPYGSIRSIVAHTENMAYVESVPRDMTMNYSQVWGNGGVGGVIINGQSYAGGNANFNYNGYTNGQGQADLRAVVNTSGQATTAYVSGSSSAVANGFDRRDVK